MWPYLFLNKNKYVNLPLNIYFYLNWTKLNNFESLLNCKNRGLNNYYLTVLNITDFFISYEYGLYLLIQPISQVLNNLDLPFYDKITETENYRGFELSNLIEFYFFSDMFVKIFCHKPYIRFTKGLFYTILCKPLTMYKIKKYFYKNIFLFYIPHANRFFVLKWHTKIFNKLFYTKNNSFWYNLWFSFVWFQSKFFNNLSGVRDKLLYKYYNLTYKDFLTNLGINETVAIKPLFNINFLKKDFYFYSLDFFFDLGDNLTRQNEIIFFFEKFLSTEFNLLNFFLLFLKFQNIYINIINNTKKLPFIFLFSSYFENLNENYINEICENSFYKNVVDYNFSTFKKKLFINVENLYKYSWKHNKTLLFLSLNLFIYFEKLFFNNLLFFNISKSGNKYISINNYVFSEFFLEKDDSVISSDILIDQISWESDNSSSDKEEDNFFFIEGVNSEVEFLENEYLDKEDPEFIEYINSINYLNLVYLNISDSWKKSFIDVFAPEDFTLSNCNLFTNLFVDNVNFELNATDDEDPSNLIFFEEKYLDFSILHFPHILLNTNNFLDKIYFYENIFEDFLKKEFFFFFESFYKIDWFEIYETWEVFLSLKKNFSLLNLKKYISYSNNTKKIIDYILFWEYSAFIHKFFSINNMNTTKLFIWTVKGIFSEKYEFIYITFFLKAPNKVNSFKLSILKNA